VGWQETAALSIVGLTAGIFLWSRWRPRRFSLQRDTHCGCASPAQSGARHSIVFHARKGQQPQVMVKMK